MNVEVINTGTEILLGNVLNTHVATLAEGLFPLGLRIGRQVAVPDGEAIREELAAALGRAELIFITGGLGPTTDDLTREITAEWLGLPLHFNEEIMTRIAARFAQRGMEITERVQRQARVPEGAVVLPNENGTAPGLYLEVPLRDGPRKNQAARSAHLFLLPGPPRELRPMFQQSVLPLLRRILTERREISGDIPQECRVYHTLGVGESIVEAMIGERLLAIPHLELGYCARPGEVDIRCIGPREALEVAEAIILEALGEQMVTLHGRTVEQAVFDTLLQRKETLATAESCTGGNLAHRLTNLPGASAILKAGFIPYENEAKTRDLGVPAALIATHGAVSAPVAAAMAQGALKRANTDWALALTGIAGPGSGTPEKPVGTVFIALACRGGSTQVESHHFSRERDAFKDIAARTALLMLLHAMN